MINIEHVTPQKLHICQAPDCHRFAFNIRCANPIRKITFKPMKVLKTWESQAELMNKIFVKNTTCCASGRDD